MVRSDSRDGTKDAREGVTPTSNPPATAARPDAPARSSHHTEEQSPRTGGEGEDWEGRKRGGEAQEIPEEF